MFNAHRVLPKCPDDWNGYNVLVIGEKANCEAVISRMLTGVEVFEDNDERRKYQFHWSEKPVGGVFDQIFIIDQTQSIKIDKRITRAGRIDYLSQDECQLKANAQKLLDETDWQALRDIERELLDLHNSGVHTLSGDVYQRMQDREQMRTDVEKEIMSMVQINK